MYTEANRLAWNQAMPKHQAANQGKWDERFATPGYSVFKDPELAQLDQLGIAGKDIFHPCCNNGVELMSLKNLGAQRCVGMDISDAAIEEASARSQQSGVACEFVRSDVYDIDAAYDGSFDIIYVSIGCFGWLPDLKAFLVRLSALLREDGHLFIYEEHPFAQMLSSDDDVDADPLKIIDPYFKTEPYEENDGLDYVGKTSYDATSSFWFVWTLSDLIMGIREAGFSIQFFQEYTDDISASHARNQQAGVAIPLSYILVAEKCSTAQGPQSGSEDVGHAAKPG